MKRLRIHTESQYCRDCQACTLACSLYHEGECNLSLARLAVIKDMAKYEFELRVCRHCDDPACLESCPTGAIKMDDRGIASISQGECINCGMCASNCPYGAIAHDEMSDRYLKCDLCAGREDGPICVEICPVGALTFVEEGE